MFVVSSSDNIARRLGRDPQAGSLHSTVCLKARDMNMYARCVAK